VRLVARIPEARRAARCIHLLPFFEGRRPVNWASYTLHKDKRSTRTTSNPKRYLSCKPEPQTTLDRAAKRELRYGGADEGLATETSGIQTGGQVVADEGGARSGFPGKRSSAQPAFNGTVTQPRYIDSSEMSIVGPPPRNGWRFFCPQIGWQVGVGSSLTKKEPPGQRFEAEPRAI